MTNRRISNFDDLVAVGATIPEYAGRKPPTETELVAAIITGGDWMKAAATEYGRRFEAVLAVAAATAGQLPDDLENLDLGTEAEAFDPGGLELLDKDGRLPRVAWNFSEDGEIRLPYPVYDADPLSGLAELHAALLYPGVAHDEDADVNSVETWTAAIPRAFELVQRLWRAMPEDKRTLHPVGALIAGYWNRAVPVEPAPKNKRRIFPGPVVHGREEDRRVPKLYTPAHHTDPDNPQRALPGFEHKEGPRIALPLEIWRIGEGREVSPGRGLPVSQRLFIGALVTTKQLDRHGINILDLTLTLRDVKEMLYPNSRPNNTQFWATFLRAVEDLERMPRIPIYRPQTNTTGLRRVLYIPEIPSSPTELDGHVIIRIDLPTGSRNGPMLPLDWLGWAAKDAPAARLLINLAAHWHNPGQSIRPTGRRTDGRGRMWLGSANPEDYPEVSDDNLVTWAFPTAANKNRRRTLHQARQTLAELERAGAVVIEGRKVLPPPDYRAP